MLLQPPRPRRPRPSLRTLWIPVQLAMVLAPCRLALTPRPAQAQDQPPSQASPAPSPPLPPQNQPSPAGAAAKPEAPNRSEAPVQPEAPNKLEEPKKPEAPAPSQGAAKPQAPDQSQAPVKPATPVKLSRKEVRERLAKLPPRFRDWLAEVEVLISDEERDFFLTLEKDYQRDAFIQHFFEARDAKFGGHGEFQRRWRTRLEEAHAEFGTSNNDARIRIYLLNGSPAARVESTCSQLLWPLDIWYYAGSELLPGDFLIVFYRPFGNGPYRLWDPIEGLQQLFVANRPDLEGVYNGCKDGDRIANMLASVSSQGLTYENLESRFDSKMPPPGGEWLSTFLSYSTDLPEGAPQLPARLAVNFLGSSGNRTAVQGVVTVPVAAAGVLSLNDRRSHDFSITGEVIASGELFEHFRYKFDFVAGSAGASLPLAFQRLLRPGSYTLIVKVEDLNGRKFFRVEQSLEVPRLEQAAPGAEIGPQGDPEAARLLAEANAAALTGETTLKLVAPRGELQTGMLRFDTLTTGRGIDHVTFSLDGKPLLTKRKPPYSVELDLGSLPRPHHLQATAFDPAGAELAEDALEVNAAAHRFRIRLAEPQRGKHYESSLLARAETDVPDGDRIDRVELFLNETRVATLYQPPYTQPIVLPRGQPLSYVRAVAYTTDGNSTEDIVFVNSPDNVEQLNVQFVELYTSVVDKRGRPVTGLEKRDFSVSEDRKPQEVARFERVVDLPVHAAVVLDTSASMEKALDKARDAALQFLQQAIKPKDRAAVITFNDHPNVTVKFTNDPAALASGLAALKAERSTALYDTIIFSLYYMNGIKGQRALLLLTDGRDEGSRFTFEDALEYVRRSGVTLYAIGLGDEVEKRKLSHLAEESGGRAFFIKSAAELPGIYAGIEEDLRSQYLVAYQSTNSSNSEGSFRTVEVKVDRPGLEAKTIHGYYP